MLLGCVHRSNMASLCSLTDAIENIPFCGRCDDAHRSCKKVKRLVDSREIDRALYESQVSVRVVVVVTSTRDVACTILPPDATLLLLVSIYI